MLNLKTKLKSGMGESQFEIWARMLPTFLNYFESLALSVFPFVLLSMLATGGLRAIQIIS